VKKKNYRSLVTLPLDFHISSFQLLHPLFYDKKQHNDVIKMMAKYKKQSSSNFDEYVNLDEKYYKLVNWVQRVSNNSPNYTILETTWNLNIFVAAFTDGLPFLFFKGLFNGFVCK
jgi:hypothetical protein